MPSFARQRLFLPLLLLPVVAGRFEAGTMVSTPDQELRWQYMGKFGYGIGKGTWEARVKPQDHTSAVVLQLELFLDEDWPKVATLPTCSPQVARLARASREIVASGGEWSSWADGEVEQSQRAHIWYFALSGCSAVGRNATAGVDFEVRYRQPDESELSVELRLMPCATLLAVLCLSGFLAHVAHRCRSLRQSMGQVPPVVRVLVGATVLQWAAEVLHLLHLQLYEKQGMGESSLEATSGILFMLSQVASCTLLIAIAKGYTLVSSGDLGLDSMKRFAVIVAILKVGLVGHDAWQGDHSDKHHENEGAVGWTIVIVRLLLLAWFITCVRSLHQRCRSLRLQGFLERFQLAGSAYFLAYPVIYTVVQVVAPYLQHPILHIGTAASQTCASIWLSDLFLSKGAYFQVSTLSSPLLPGGVGGARASLKGD